MCDALFEALQAGDSRRVRFAAKSNAKQARFPYSLYRERGGVCLISRCSARRHPSRQGKAPAAPRGFNSLSLLRESSTDVAYGCAMLLRNCCGVSGAHVVACYSSPSNQICRSKFQVKG
eukprot:2762557-Rhodomonas_salina.1